VSQTTKKRFEVVNVMKAADDLLEVTENPRHRAILENYRYHAVLEISGKWDQILTTDLMVPEPHYRIMGPKGTDVFNGMDEVATFYRAFIEAGTNVFGAVDESEKIAVADWGFASESVFGHMLPGQLVLEDGIEVDDPEASYLVTHRLAMFWPYDGDAKLIGEFVYDDLGSYEVEKVDPADVVTPQMAAEALAPLLEAYRPRALAR
jgi:hypothetical protein